VPGFSLETPRLSGEMVSLVEREKSEPQIPDEKGMALFAGTRPLVSFSGLRK